MLSNFHYYCRLLIFFQKFTFSKMFYDIFRVLISLDTDQARRFVGPDLGPNCLQRLSADGCQDFALFRFYDGI